MTLLFVDTRDYRPALLLAEPLHFNVKIDTILDQSSFATVDACCDCHLVIVNLKQCAAPMLLSRLIRLGAMMPFLRCPHQPLRLRRPG